MDDLSLLERVFIRMGSAESDDQLETAIIKFLPPVLLKLGSQQEGVRKKVMELLVHINKRIKSRPNIQLPMQALFEQYQDPDSTSFITNFTLIYLKLGFPRLQPDQQSQFIPAVIQCLQNKPPPPHQDSLLQLLTSALQHVKFSQDPNSKPWPLNIAEKPIAMNVILEYLLDFLLLPYGVLYPKSISPGQAIVPPPGLSEIAWKRVSGEEPWKAEDLERCKTSAVSFLCCGIFPEDSVLVHLIVAAADTRFTVANAADSALKKIGRVADWEAAGLVTKLYWLYLGSGPAKNAGAKPDQKRTPACTRLRLKLLTYLLKSRAAASAMPAALQLTFESLFGEQSNVKLKHLALQFVHHVIQNCVEARLAAIAPLLLSALTKVAKDDSLDAKLKASAVTGLGKLGQRLPSSVTQDMAVVQLLFNAMNQEDAEARMSVQEALHMLITPLKLLGTEHMQLLLALLQGALQSELWQLRSVAVQYLGNVYSHSHAPSRYLLLMASGDNKPEVRQEAMKLLYASLPKTDEEIEKMKEKQDKGVLLPSFCEMTSHVVHEMKLVTTNEALPCSPDSFNQLLNYLRLCLAYSAGLMPYLDLLNESETIASGVRDYVSQLVNKTVLVNYISLALKALASPSHANAIPLLALLEIVGPVPDKLAPLLRTQVDILQSLLAHSKEEVRQAAAELLAIVVVQLLPPSDVEAFLGNLNRWGKDRSLEAQQGVVLAQGYVLARQHLLNRPANNDLDMVTRLTKLLDSTEHFLLWAAVEALGEMGRCGALKSIAGELQAVAETLLNLLKNVKLSVKLREGAARTCGLMNVGHDGPQRRYIMEELLKFAQEAKDVESLFTLGETLANTALGNRSKFARDLWSVKEEDWVLPVVENRSEQSQSHLAWLLDTLLDEYAGKVHPLVKQCCCVWLLSLVKICRNEEELAKRLPKIQRAFMNLLAEGNEFVQEVSSKGLSLVYDSGTPEQQRELVDELMGCLTTGKRPVMQVSADTKIFEEGALGKSPIGGQLSTYKELCSLATDLNQPDLIYKFMHLANHNAMWNSKKGAAFGFSSIAARAGAQLEPVLPAIIPRLFRYQFDPQVQVRTAMSEIWSSLVKENNKTLDTYLLPILQDLLTHLTDTQWRVRESCCMGLAELLRGRTLEPAVHFLEELWKTLFRVQDDIKESVRKAAEAALKALSKTCVTMVNVEESRSGGARVIEVILPVLLTDGITSGVQEVHSISLDTVVKVVRSAGILTRSHLPALAVALLEGAAAAENSLNYLSVRLGDQHATQEKFDLARIAALKSSIFFETLQFCLQFADESVYPGLVSALNDCIKSSAALTVRGGATHVMILLTQQPALIQPHVGKLLAALVRGISDRNTALKKTFASAIGHLARVAKESSLDKLLQTLQGWYLESTDVAMKAACLSTLTAMHRHSPDVIQRHANLALPLIFLAKHYVKTDVADPEAMALAQNWEELWLEVTPSGEVALKLHMKEICSLLQLASSSDSWTLKAQAGVAVAGVANTLKSRLDDADRSELLKIVLLTLQGRTWEGKEHILFSVAALCNNCPEDWDKRGLEPKTEEVIKCALREARKEAPAYKQHALLVTGQVLEALKVDRFEEVWKLVEPILQPPEKEEGDEEMDDKETRDRSLALEEVALLTVGRCFPSDPKTQYEYYERVVALFCKKIKEGGTRQLQMAVFRALAKAMAQIDLLDSATCKEQVARVLVGLLSPALVHGIENVNFASVRGEGLDVMKIVLQKFKDPKIRVLLSPMKRDSNARVEVLVRDPTPEVKQKASQIILLWADLDMDAQIMDLE